MHCTLHPVYIFYTFAMIALCLHVCAYPDVNGYVYGKVFNPYNAAMLQFRPPAFPFPPQTCTTVSVV